MGLYFSKTLPFLNVWISRSFRFILFTSLNRYLPEPKNDRDDEQLVFVDEAEGCKLLHDGPAPQPRIEEGEDVYYLPDE